MTLGITVALIVYALTIKINFIIMGSVFFVIRMTLILFGLFASLFGCKTPLVNIIYSSKCVILYGFYLIYEI